MTKIDLTAQRLRELLHYDPETGVFTRLVRSAQRVKIGDVAGCRHSTGYIRIKIVGRDYKGHRLAWLWMTGAWPTHQIDHRDGKPWNNAWGNLRDVTKTVNAQNLVKARKDSKSGLLGVWKKSGGPGWISQINFEGRQRYIGCFPTAAEASAAYIVAKRRLHDGCTI